MASALNDRYELIESIPAVVGDFVGEAYKVRETVPPDGSPAGRVVMLRQIRNEANTANVTAAAQRSRDLGRHPNILVTFGLVEIGEGASVPAGFYVETEYARGISLRERIRRVAPFSLAITLEIAIAVAQAVQFAAQKGVNHGNLCPEQILLTPEGQVRVADFGLSAEVHESLGETMVCPPEDIKALGSLINEMLTAAAPAPIPAEGLSPRALNANVPPALDGIVRKATTADIAVCYTSITNMLVDLQACREDLRNNKPLNWSPLGAPSQANRAPKVAPGLMTQALTEISQEDKKTPKQPITPPPDYYEDAPQGGSAVAGRFLTVLIVILIVGFIAVVAVVSTMLTVSPDVKIPNLVGKQLSDAQKMGGSQFNVVETDHDYNDTWPVNTIYAQDPTAGHMIKKGKSVDVSVSDGPPQVKVPELTQMTLSRAKETLASASLEVGSVTEAYDDINPKGIVTDQTPASSSMIAHNTPVNLTVSKGPSPPATPDGLSASGTIQSEIDLSWNPVSNASTYNLYRDGKKLQTALADPAYSDLHLGDGETHQYTVTSVNGNGESAQSPPVSATTLLPGGQAPVPVAPPVAPPSTPLPPTTPGQTGPRMREFHVRFRVPRHGDQHRVQITLQDATGINQSYDEMKPSGSTVETDIQGFGNKVILRIYIDNKLEKQETK